MMEQTYIDRLYQLLERLQKANENSDTIAALRWAIFQLEQQRMSWRYHVNTATMQLHTEQR